MADTDADWEAMYLRMADLRDQAVLRERRFRVALRSIAEWDYAYRADFDPVQVAADALNDRMTDTNCHASTKDEGAK